MHACINWCMQARIPTYLPTCMHAGIHTCMRNSIPTDTHTYICMYVPVCVCACVCAPPPAVCVCDWVCVCVPTCTHSGVVGNAHAHVQMISKTRLPGQESSTPRSIHNSWKPTNRSPTAWIKSTKIMSFLPLTCPAMSSRTRTPTTLTRKERN